jgi:sugar lactone lactonase YvrE
MSEVEHLLSLGNECGEGPLWAPAEKAVYWVDIPAGKVFRYHPETRQHETFQFDLPITALGMRRRGGFVVATARGFAFWNPPSGRLETIASPEADRPNNRFNDGAVDRQGRFWAGTMNQVQPEAPDGSLYRLGTDLSVHKMAGGFAVYNGGAWSPDGRTMYVTNTLPGEIWAYEFDPSSGEIGNRRLFARVPAEDGWPDGHTVDSEGCLWSAHWGGWRITRYDPAGKIERVIKLPVSQVSCCRFGGEDMDVLYVTTAWESMTSEQRQAEPMAGDLFRVQVDVKGLPEPRFEG